MALSVSEVLPSAGAATTRRQIWSIGGGKGGIGKSLLAASIGWQLARMGRRVVLVDADLGGANLHTCLGLPAPARTLADFIQRRVETIDEVLTDTQAPGLRVISGAADLLSAANIKHLQKVRVMNQVRALDVDVVLIDLGAGTSFNILDFFLLSDVSILAVVPEPTSIENGYRFIKSALYRRLRAIASTDVGPRPRRRGARPQEPGGHSHPGRARRPGRERGSRVRPRAAPRDGVVPAALRGERGARHGRRGDRAPAGGRVRAAPRPARELRGLRAPRRRGLAARCGGGACSCPTLPPRARRRRSAS